MEHQSLQEDEQEGDSGFYDDSSSSVPPDHHDRDHIRSLQIFSDDLQKSIANSFPRSKSPYTSVHVLLLRWTDDDLNVQVELTKLRKVFERHFNFATEQWDIPSQNPTRALQAKLYAFQDAHQSEDELLIVYYGGHGDADLRRGRSIWAAHKQLDSPTLAWSSLQHLLENAVPHVLIILDCCFAANAARDTAEGTTKELLAACGRENPTSGVGERSFTSALIEELMAFGEAPFTVTMLHSRLVTMRWKLAYTPIYALLSEHGGHSIEITPLSSSEESTPSSLDPMDVSPSQSSILSTQSPPSMSSPVADTRVLLAVSIENDAVHDISQWKTWLTSQTPWDVTKIEVKVEAVFESHSTMLLASIPIFAWDILPNKAAYQLIGFIKSENLLQPRSSSRLAAKNLKARKNPSQGSPSTPITRRHSANASPKTSRDATTSIMSEDLVSLPLSAKTTHDVEGEPSKRKLETGSILLSVREEEKPRVSEMVEHSSPKVSKTKRPSTRTSRRAHPYSKKSPVPESGIQRPAGVSFNSSSWGPADSAQPPETGLHPLNSGNVAPQHFPSDIAPSTPKPTLPSTAAGPWQPEYDAQLIEARKHSLNWADISQQYFPSKTANACRKRHERLMDVFQTTEDWEPTKLEEMAAAYVELRQQIWEVLAKEIGENWKVVETKCMEKGVKNLTILGNSARCRGSLIYASKGDCKHNNDSGCFLDERFEALTNLDDAVGHPEQLSHTLKSKDGFFGGPHLSTAEMVARFRDRASIIASPPT